METGTSPWSKKAIVALACGSRSMRRVFFFRWAMEAARLMAVVVLPTQPFWLATVRMAVIECPHCLTAGPAPPWADGLRILQLTSFLSPTRLAYLAQNPSVPEI